MRKFSSSPFLPFSFIFFSPPPPLPLLCESLYDELFTLLFGPIVFSDVGFTKFIRLLVSLAPWFLLFT